jgi:hypothetical protein
MCAAMSLFELVRASPRYQAVTLPLGDLPALTTLYRFPGHFINHACFYLENVPEATCFAIFRIAAPFILE